MGGGGGSSSKSTTQTQTQNLNLQGINGAGVAGNSGDTTITATDFGAISSAADIAVATSDIAGQTAQAAIDAALQSSRAASDAAARAAAESARVSADAIAASKQMARESAISAENMTGKALGFGKTSVDAVVETSINAMSFGTQVIDSLAKNQDKSIATVAGAMRSDAAQSLNVMTKWGMGAMAVVAIAMLFARAKA